MKGLRRTALLVSLINERANEVNIKKAICNREEKEK
jgi:hypothetical protein